MPKVGDKRYINTRTNAVMTRPLGVAGMTQVQTWDGKQWVNGENVVPQTNQGNRGTTGGDVSLVTPSWMSIVNQQPKTPEEQPKETPKKNNNFQSRWKKTSTYTAPDGSVHEGMTQEEFNQRMQDYQMENDALKKQDNTQLQDLYNRALDKYMKEPDSFTEAQKQALVNTAEKLGHLDTLLPSIVTGENMTNITSSTPTVTATSTANTQASSLPTVNQVTNQDNNASNYGGRYAGSEAGSEETRKSQGASNAASFWL